MPTIERSPRIVHIIPAISLVYGGPSQAILGLSAALARQGAEVTVLTTDANGDAGQPPLDVPLDRPVWQDGYCVRYFRCSPFRRYKFSLPLLQWLWQHASEFDVAHVHALFSPVSSLAATVARSRRLPYILRPLGTLDPADLRKKRGLKQIYATLLERPNLQGAAAIHFTSSEEAEISERFGATTRDAVIPLGVSLPEIGETVDPQWQSLDAKLRSLHQSGCPIVLFMSRIEPKKGLDLLIPALKRLTEDGENFHFVLAGSNPQDSKYEANIRQQIATSSLGQKTTITGFVRGEFKTRLLQWADLFVLPSYYENFGIAVAEAMAAGTAVVISDRVQIYQEVRDANAGWVCGCNVEELVACLQGAIANLTECRDRGNAAKAFALSHYSWDAIAREAIDTYRDILSRSRSD